MKNELMLAALWAVVGLSGFSQQQYATCRKDELGACTGDTDGRKCDPQDDRKVCNSVRTASGFTCQCAVPATPTPPPPAPKKGKTGGSITAQRFDPAAAAQLRKLADEKPVQAITIPIRFTQLPGVNQTTAFLANGEVLREPTALTGGTALMRVTPGAEPGVVEIKIESLSLEASGFSFSAVQPAVTGTLNLETGLFQVTVTFGEFETPETRTPFAWQGSAYGRYDFATGIARVIESGVGQYLTVPPGR